LPPRREAAGRGPARSVGLIALLSALVALGPISTDLYLPSLPILADAFAAPVPAVQATLSVFLAGFALGMLAYGPISDRIGRRPAAIGALVLYLAASVACALAPSIEALIAWRFVQSLGAAGGPVLARAIVRDLYERETAARVLAYTTMAMALAPALGPVLGGFLTEWLGWRANFWALTGAAAAILAAVLATLGETNRVRDPTATRPSRLAANYRALLSHRAFAGYMLVVAFVYSGIFVFISGSSFVLMDGLGLSPQAYGFAFGGVVCGYIVGTFGATRLTRRLGVDRTIRLGTAVCCAGGLALLLAALAAPPSVAGLVGPYVLFMIGAGLTLPNAFAGGIGPFPEKAGAASALMGFTQMAVGALAGILVGQLTDRTALPLGAMLLATSLCAGASFALLAGRRRTAGAAAD
jgi:DHA1 family bicyclomycin/chloramphenicol resistance-like MFS transporter